MASNDPIASQARKPALSVEDADRFASQIRPSWELLGPDASTADFGLDDAPGVAAPPAGAASRAPDTIIEGVPTVAVAGSDEEVPVDTSWDVDEPPAATSSGVDAGPIEPQRIASVGVISKAEVPVADLPLPPQVGHPMVPTPGAPVAPAPAAKTKVGIGGTSGERAPLAKPKPTRAPASTPAPAAAKATSAPASTRAGAGPASTKADASRSRPGTTNPGAAYVPAAGEAEDDIALPISGAPKGLLLKIGGGVAAIAVILIAVKLFSGSGKPDPAKTPPPVATTAAAIAPPPALDPSLAEPVKTAIPTAAVTAAPTAAPTVAATAAPTAKEKPVVAKVEPPPPVATVKKSSPPPPPAGGTTPPAGGKKGGGIIRETPF